MSKKKQKLLELNQYYLNKSERTLKEIDDISLNNYWTVAGGSIENIIIDKNPPKYSKDRHNNRFKYPGYKARRWVNHRAVFKSCTFEEYST